MIDEKTQERIDIFLMKIIVFFLTIGGLLLGLHYGQIFFEDISLRIMFTLCSGFFGLFIGLIGGIYILKVRGV